LEALGRRARFAAAVVPDALAGPLAGIAPLALGAAIIAVGSRAIRHRRHSQSEQATEQVAAVGRHKRPRPSIKPGGVHLASPPLSDDPHSLAQPLPR
jgi:hypothetical protein